MKNKFIASTLILMIGGLFTKLLGFVIKILYTRMIGEEGIALYMLVMPTYSLLLTIANLALPVAISKLVAEDDVSSKRIVFSSVFIMMILNGVLIAIVFTSSDFIANHLLQNPSCKTLLHAMALTLPFVSLSAILKGYFFGRQKMVPHTVSNILEQVVRLILITIFIPFLVRQSTFLAVIGLILLSIASETSSIIVFLFFLPKDFTIKKSDIMPDLATMKNVFSLSLPTVSSRLIGNIGYFFEPIILTNLLLFSGYSNSFILREYGAYNAYSIGLLTMPSFFIAALSSALVPELSKFYSRGDMESVKRRFRQAMSISMILGILFSAGIFFSSSFLLKLVYNTSMGNGYIKVLAPWFFLFYLEGPLISTLQAIGKAKDSMQITLLGVFVKTAVLAIFSLLHIGIYGLVISEIVDIVLVVTLNYRKIRQYLFSKPKEDHFS